MKKQNVFLILVGIGVCAAALWGPVMSNVEQAKYDVVEAYDNIEIRAYAPMIVAEANVVGDREVAIRDGFRIIADYIFGNNIAAQKVEMTAPVIQQASEKIAMTAPVSQQENNSAWTVRFVMPAHYTLQTLPKPKNPNVVIREIPQKHFAVIRFSGDAKSEKLKNVTAELNGFMESKNIKKSGLPVYAFFNPPWTLPFLRRNEVMIEIDQ